MGRPIQIDVDCADPERLATFWAEVLEYEVAEPLNYESWLSYSEAEAKEPGERWCAAFDPAAGAGPRLLFHRVPEAKTVKNRLHLDVFVSPRDIDLDGRWAAVDAEVERLVGMGAESINRSPEDECFVVMRDPEGNEFCVCG